MRTCAALLLLFCSVAHAEKPKDLLPPPPTGKTWVMIWHDEFAGDALDTNKWNNFYTKQSSVKRHEGWWNWNAVNVDGKGHLVIRTFKDGDKYIGGCITTAGHFEHAFGYYVARIQLQQQPGHWTAFWMTSHGASKVGSGGREGTEIDIMEKPRLSDLVHHTFHWDGYGSEHKMEEHQVNVPGVMKGFHTFALWWQPKEYVFYVDGKQTLRRAGMVCQVPEYLLLSTAVGTWGGDITKAHLPDPFLVDYVRVYDLVDKK